MYSLNQINYFSYRYYNNDLQQCIKHVLLPYGEIEGDTMMLSDSTSETET